MKTLNDVMAGLPAAEREAVERRDRLIERLRTVTIPVEIVSAAEDRLVDNSAQAAAARNLPQGRLITVPGAYHEILMETDERREQFWKGFEDVCRKAGI